MAAVMGLIGSLTNRGGPADGFLQLLGGAARGGGGEGGASSTSNIVKILLGLAKSYFNVKSGSSPAIQGWDAAGAKDNQDDKNYLNWALALIRDLFFPGKKPKEIIEQGGDDSIKDDLDSGGKKDEGDVKGWIDGHPEIGKMQKDIFDDIFDTKEDDKSLGEMSSRVCYQGPTILVVKDTEGNVFGAHASTSWIDTEGGWVGNGESFLFSIEPKMAVFHSTGKDENFQALSSEMLAMGGTKGNHGFELNDDLSGGCCSDDIQTFHTIQLSHEPSFSVDHVEV